MRRIVRLGHSSHLLKLRGRLADRPGVRPRDHYDHLDVPTIAALKERVGRYFVPPGVGQRLRDWGVAADRIEEMDWW